MEVIIHTSCLTESWMRNLFVKPTLLVGLLDIIAFVLLIFCCLDCHLWWKKVGCHSFPPAASSVSHVPCPRLLNKYAKLTLLLTYRLFSSYWTLRWHSTMGTQTETRSSLFYPRWSKKPEASQTGLRTVQPKRLCSPSQSQLLGNLGVCG